MTADIPLSDQPVPDLKGIISTDVTYEARSQVDRAAFLVAQQAEREGCTGLIRPPTPGDPSRLSPVAGWWAYRLLADTAAGQARYALNRARSEGMGWRDLGVAMLYAGDNVDPAQMAFETASLEPHGTDPRLIVWDCRGDGGCGQWVTDYGPGHHPDDSESGHADGCARHAREIAAWRSGWDDEDGDEG